MQNYRISKLGDVKTTGRKTLHDELALTGMEISINELPAKVSIPFVHSHKQNEEVYIILNGKGQFYVDGDEFEVEEGSVIYIKPAGARCIKADNQTSLRYICIQAKAESLTQFTENDGNMIDAKPSWLN